MVYFAWNSKALHLPDITVFMVFFFLLQGIVKHPICRTVLNLCYFSGFIGIICAIFGEFSFPIFWCSRQICQPIT